MEFQIWQHFNSHVANKETGHGTQQKWRAKSKRNETSSQAAKVLHYTSVLWTLTVGLSISMQSSWRGKGRIIIWLCSPMVTKCSKVMQFISFMSALSYTDCIPRWQLADCYVISVTHSFRNSQNKLQNLIWPAS